MKILIPKVQSITRRYARRDHDQVVRLHYHALNDSGAYTGSGECDDDLNNIEQVYFDNGGEFLVLEIDKSIIGMGGLLKVDDNVDDLTNCVGRQAGDRIDKLVEVRRSGFDLYFGCARQEVLNGVIKILGCYASDG